MASQNLFNQGRVPGNNGRVNNVLGHGEYVLFEFDGPDYQYLVIRDSLRSNWQVSYCSVNVNGNIVLVYVGQADNLPDAEQMAIEDAGVLRDDRRDRDHEEALAAKERGE